MKSKHFKTTNARKNKYDRGRKYLIHVYKFRSANKMKISMDRRMYIP